MENNNNIVEKKKSWKRKIHLVCVLLIVVASICGYFWIRKTNSLRLEAINVMEQARKFNTLKSGINTERDRCKNFIIQGQGDFSSFEYCKKFINWADSLPSLK